MATPAPLVLSKPAPSSASAILLGCASWGDVKLALADASADAEDHELLAQHYLKLSDELGFKSVWSTLKTGKRPYGVAFDGARPWVADYGSNDVRRLY